MKHSFVCSLLIFLISTASIAEENKQDAVAWDRLHGMGDVSYFKIAQPKAEDKGHYYHIFVRSPVVEEGKEEKTYPTLYLLDGGRNFPLFSSYYHYLNFTQVVPDMIIVGISYGTDNWRKGNARGHDFTLPSSEANHFGGAKDFDAFITKTLMPEVQKRYPVDPGKQILYGQSLGGQFGLYVSLYGESPFYAVIAANPALHRNLESFKKPISRKAGLPRTFILSAEFDDPRFKTPFTAWHKHWDGKSPQWQRTVIEPAGHNHLSIVPEALRSGLMWIFAQ